MICLRCGVCCTTHAVVVVNDPDIGPVEGNLLALGSGQRCRHLVGDGPPYSCAIHERQWFPETPCGRHGQIERYADELCRLGNFHLNGANRPERLSARRLPQA